MENISEYHATFADEIPNQISVNQCPFKRRRIEQSNDEADDATTIENDQLMNSNSGGDNAASHSENLDDFDEDNELDGDEDDGKIRISVENA